MQDGLEDVTDSNTVAKVLLVEVTSRNPSYLKRNVGKTVNKSGESALDRMSITDKDLREAVDMLNRYMDLDGNDKENFHLVHQYGKVYLMKNQGSIDISSGNTKPELYWQIQTACKILSYKK